MMSHGVMIMTWDKATVKQDSSIARPKKAHVKSNINTMLICFFDIRVVHAEFVPPGPTVKHAFNLKVL